MLRIGRKYHWDFKVVMNYKVMRPAYLVWRLHRYYGMFQSFNEMVEDINKNDLASGFYKGDRK